MDQGYSDIPLDREELAACCWSGGMASIRAGYMGRVAKDATALPWWWLKMKNLLLNGKQWNG